MADVFEAYGQTVAILEQQAGELQDRYTDQMACKKGCAGCCVDGFTIQYIEGARLMQGFSALPAETAQRIVAQLQDDSPAAKMKCPLLVDDVCAVYEYRPVLCRAFGLVVKSGDKEYTCDLNFQSHSDETPLQALNIKPVYDVIDELSQELWQAQPLPALCSEEKAPVFSIRQLLEAFLAL